MINPINHKAVIIHAVIKLIGLHICATTSNDSLLQNNIGGSFGLHNTNSACTLIGSCIVIYESKCTAYAMELLYSSFI